MNRSPGFLLPAALLLALAACAEGATVAEQNPATSRPSSRPAQAARESDDAARFIRFVDEGGGEGRLETAIVTYLGPRGQHVDLVATVHVADRVYYQQLQERFESYDALLYEMVKPKDTDPTREKVQGRGLLAFFQRKMKTALDLEFQLDGIRYTEPNFVHADLDVATFSKLSKDRGESIVALMLKVMADHQRKQPQDEDELTLGQLFAAFMSEDSSRLLKHLLARQLHDVELTLAGLSEGKGSVLLTERNKRCLEVLVGRLQEGDRRVGIFYGGAHMPDLEKRLLTELGFKRLEQRWLTAWDIKKRPAGQPPTPAGPQGKAR